MILILSLFGVAFLIALFLLAWSICAVSAKADKDIEEIEKKINELKND